MDLAWKAHAFFSLFLISFGLLMLLAIRRPVLRGLAAALTLLPLLRTLNPSSPGPAEFLALAAVGAGLVAVFSLHTEDRYRRTRVIGAAVPAERVSQTNAETSAAMVRT